MIDFFIYYFLIGLVVSSIVSWFQLARYPHAKLYFAGLVVSVVIWPVYVTAFIISLIKEGW